jgi:hypothetical protein
VHTTARILKNSPFLTELLILHNDEDSSDEIDALIATLTSPTIAPHLHLIFFGCEDESHLDYMAYLEMLKSRRTAENCALKSAALIIEDGIKPDSETIHGLHGLRQQGLNLFCWRELRLGKKLLAGTTDPYGVDFFAFRGTFSIPDPFGDWNSIFLFHSDVPHCYFASRYTAT